MRPITITSERLVLTAPVASDVDAITAACQEPIFERFMTTPWPYERRHAESFVAELVPDGWHTETELTWALRPSAGATAIGMLGTRTYPDGVIDLGYWLAAHARGSGLMVEAVRAVVGWLHTERHVDEILWEAFPGNVASARVAQHCGFAYAGLHPSRVQPREGSTPMAWHGTWSADADSDQVRASWRALA
ncbi:GNAT family N-acetyltransferase [Microbacteriaceae bacterium VKM Ac-2855]|nr:GNAT family N-acetyltransferase [Microbacteriaceae bacterium VKM Ac-2855]